MNFGLNRFVTYKEQSERDSVSVSSGIDHFSQCRGKVVVVGVVEKLDFNGEIERHWFELVREIWVTRKTDCIFFSGDNYAVFAFHGVETFLYQFDVLALVVVMVGKNIDLHSWQETLEIADKWARVTDTGNGENVVVLTHPIEVRDCADGIREKGHQILISVSREE